MIVITAFDKKGREVREEHLQEELPDELEFKLDPFELQQEGLLVIRKGEDLYLTETRLLYEALELEEDHDEYLEPAPNPSHVFFLDDDEEGEGMEELEEDPEQMEDELEEEPFEEEEEPLEDEEPFEDELEEEPFEDDEEEDPLKEDFDLLEELQDLEEDELDYLRNRFYDDDEEEEEEDFDFGDEPEEEDLDVEDPDLDCSCLCVEDDDEDEEEEEEPVLIKESLEQKLDREVTKMLESMLKRF